MATAEVLIEQQGAALILTLSNPGLRNALAPDMYHQFLPALERAATEASVRAVILTGADGVFCAGGDLNRLRANRAAAPEVQAASIEALHRLARALADVPKPVIAAVEGAAAGAGFSLALGCDLIIAAASARFVMAYVKVGLSPDGGGSWYLTRGLPRQAAAELMLGGEAVAASRLQQWGLVNEVVADGTTRAAALRWVERFADLSPHALGRIKRLMRHAEDACLEDHFGAERDSFVACLHHADAGEAIDAFFAKRKSRF